MYGLTGSFDQAFRRVDLDRSQRRGILTQAGFLASRAYAADPDPIHRGVAINVRLLCATLPSPPSMIPALPMVAPGRTNRQTVEAHTGVGTCGAACHATLINPIGFAFERYDSVGAYRTTDRGFSVDSSGEYPLDGRATRFADALALSDALADSRQTHECYARYWLEYLAGRGPQPEDRPLIARIGERSRADEPVLALIESIVASPTFTARSAAVEVMR